MGRGAKGYRGMGTTASKNAGVVAWLEFEVANDGPHFSFVDAYDASIPADPELVADGFGWDFVVREGEFYVIIAMDGASAFSELAEGLGRQWTESRPFNILKLCKYVLLVVPWIRWPATASSHWRRWAFWVAMSGN